MAYPSIISTLATPQPTDRLSSPSHSTLHQNENSAILEIERAVGFDSSILGTVIGDLRNPLSNGGGHVQTANKGGTGQTTYGKGDLLVGQNTSTLTKLAIGTDGQVPIADSSQVVGVRWGLVGAQVTFVTVASVWTKPAGANFVDVLVIASGGGGGGSGQGLGGGGGGGAGGYVQAHIPASFLPASVLVQATSGGLGGAGTTGPSGGNGSTGSIASFGSIIALGGGAGNGNITTTGGTAGAGGNASLPSVFALFGVTYQGSAGGAGGSSGNAGANGVTINSATSFAPTGGGGGGGDSHNGGAGGSIIGIYPQPAAGGAGGATAAVGNPGAVGHSASVAGTGGGGGAGSTGSGAGGAGGAGGTYGSGGGGGGYAGLGAGGSGAAGGSGVVIITVS